MQTGYLIFLLIFPISSEACCVRNHQNKRKGRQQNMTYLCYKAVEGEIFMMPCIKSDNNQTVKWSRTEEGNKGDKGSAIDCGSEFPIEEKHSGKYICPGSKLSLHLQVVKKNSLGCSLEEESSVLLRIGAGSTIQCPCFNGSDNTDVTWYKGKKAIFEHPVKRASCEENGALTLCQVSELDSGVYFCDRQISEHGVQCTFRRTVIATAIPLDPPGPPRIMYPNSSTAEEVELGHSHTLRCEVYFPFEVKFSPEVQWLKHHGGNLQNETLLSMTELQQEKNNIEYKVTQRSIIEKVTPQHLNDTYTCIATNSVGNTSVTIKLKRKTKVKWPSLVGYPIATLLLIGGLGLIVHVNWLELKLIYRSRLQHQHNREEREFDVFLSFVWSNPSTVTEGVWALSTRPGCETDEEGHLSRFGLLSSKEGKVTHRPLEVLLPQVLEDRWGYRLCLLERDVLPGGEYLSNSEAVFVLESGVQALLHTACPKLLLIWTNRESAPHPQTNPPLPVLVQRALKVLPSLHWTSDDPPRVASTFWRHLRKTMPDL